MLIEIFTKALLYNNGFYLYRTEVLTSAYGKDENTVKEFWECNTQFEADLLNVGLALKYITDFDKQFGIEVKAGFIERKADNDFKNINKQSKAKEKYRAYKESEEKCPAIVYTENTEVFNNLYYSIRYYESVIIRKMLAKIQLLQNQSLITISMPTEILENWKMDAVKRYA